MRPETNTESRESTPRKILRKAGKPLLYLALGAGGAMVLAGAARGAAPGGAVDNFFTKTMGGAFKFGRDRMHGVRNAYHARNAGVAKGGAESLKKAGEVGAKGAGADPEAAKKAGEAKGAVDKKGAEDAKKAGEAKAKGGGEGVAKAKMSFDPDAKVEAAKDKAAKDAADKLKADAVKDKAAKDAADKAKADAVKKAGEAKGKVEPPPDVKKAAEDKAKDDAAKAAAKKAAEMKAKPPAPPPGLEID